MKRRIPRKELGIVCVTLLLWACAAPPVHAEQQEIKKLATELATRIQAKKLSHVTVVDFKDLDKKPNKLGKYLAQQLQSSLIEHEGQLEIVDQSEIGQLFDQVEMLDEGLLDPATGRQLGKVAGTQVLILGTVMPSSMSIRLNVRAIDLQTAKVIATGDATLVRLGVIERLAKELAGEKQPVADDDGAETELAAGKPAGKTPRPPARTIRDQGVLFELDGCSLSAGELMCEVTVTSTRDRWFLVSFDSRTWNDTGDEFSPSDLEIANLQAQKNRDDCGIKQILKNVPTPVTLTFSQFGDDASAVERFRLFWSEIEEGGRKTCYKDWRSVEFEKIALSDNPSSPHYGKGQTGGTNATGKGGGGRGMLNRLGGRLMNIVEEAATDFIEEETDKALGREDEEEDAKPKKKKDQ